MIGCGRGRKKAEVTGSVTAAFFLTAVAFFFVCLPYSHAGLVRQYYVVFNQQTSAAEEFVSKGDYRAALDMYENARAAYEKENNEMGVLLCLERMGWLKRELGEYGRALELLREAYPRGVRLNGDAAEIDSDLGDVYMFSGDSPRAREHYQRALDTLKDFVFKTSYDTLPGNKELVSIFRKCKAVIHARTSLGVLHYFAGEYREALRELNAAAGFTARVMKVCNDPQYSVYIRPDYDMYNAIGYCETVMGAVRGELGELEAARKHFSVGRDAFKEGERYFGELFNRALEFRVEFKSPGMKIDGARLKAYEDFLADAERLGTTELLWRTCYEIGRQLVKEKRYPAAHGYLARAIENLELTRSRLREDTVKKIFASSVQDVYSEMINLLFEMNQPGEGFDYLERSKGRAFLDILAGRSLKVQKRVDNQLIEKEKKVRQKVEELLRSLSATLGPKREVLSREYKKLVSEHRAVLDAIKDTSLEYAAANSVSVVAADKLSARLPEGAALVSYFIGGERTLIWVVRRGALKAVAVDVNARRLAGLVREYRDAVARRETAPVLESGGRLYELLIAPVKEELAGAEKLFIVPTGVLHYLPFAGLTVSGGRFLIDDFTLSVLPNASSLLYLDKEVTADTEHILAVGNPLLKDPGRALKFAEEEITAACANFPRSSALTGARAREAVFREKDIIDTGVIHIAAHGVYDAQDPLKSALLLTGDDTYDGNLEAVEIYSLSMNPRLVVLSACESGVGEVENGDEMQSLNRAFLYAGAGSVVASLWSVNDRATAVLMRAFYKNLGAMDAARALRAAQLEVRRTSGYGSPYYWASFYLMGD